MCIYTFIFYNYHDNHIHLIYTQLIEEKYMSQLGNLIVKLIGSQNFNQVL